MASTEYWTHSTYTAYYTCRMICDLNSLLKRKYVGSILIISKIINILKKHNQKFASPSQERFTESAWSSTPLVPGTASQASLIGSTMRAFIQQVLAVVRENRIKTCSDQFGAKTLRFTVLDVMINNMPSLNALKHFHNIWQSPGEVMLPKNLGGKQTSHL